MGLSVLLWLLRGAHGSKEALEFPRGPTRRPADGHFLSHLMCTLCLWIGEGTDDALCILLSFCLFPAASLQWAAAGLFETHCVVLTE